MMMQHVGDPPWPAIPNPWPAIPQWQYPSAQAPPRSLMVNMPLSTFGVTIAVLDSDGNLTIKIDQPKPEQ